MTGTGETIRRAWRRLPLPGAARAALRALAARGLPSLFPPSPGSPPPPGAVHDALGAGAPPPAPPLLSCRSRGEYESLVGSDGNRERLAFDRSLAEGHASCASWAVRGWCDACGEARLFLVEPGPSPNWRESLACEGCGLNNRQRLVVRLARALAPRAAYAQERVTPFFSALSRLLAPASVEGSEYLGPGRRPGETVGGVRHEDAEALTFPDGAFDLVASNDVLEHVPDPRRAIGEIARVLRPGGTLLATIPFHSALDASRRRAEMAGGRVRHLLPPAWHGNPLSPEGSLVFTDFGWDFLPWLREAGFSDGRIDLCWSPPHGHLGGLQPVFVARKGGTP